jgi:O-antigen ligase
MFLQVVLSVKLKVLSKIKELQSLSFALNLNIRLFAVASIQVHCKSVLSIKLLFLHNFLFLFFLGYFLLYNVLNPC